jgi:succinate dehydrogenase / fumarate reductase cytochrome b subunit
MIRLKKALTSSVGQKFVMSLTGLGLVGFVITHLLGNLALYRKDGAPFNAYAHMLEGLGGLLYAAEIGLVAIFVIHVVTAIGLKLNHSAARPVGYRKLQSKGAPSRWNLSSVSMIFTGLLLLAFLILHIWQFKFGPGAAQGYVAQVQGHEMRDLHRLVVETFQSPFFVGIYVFAMLVLGLHLRHGFWSAFQSLGALNPRVSPAVSALGVAVAVVLSAGFLFIPLWIYFGLGG